MNLLEMKFHFQFNRFNCLQFKNHGIDIFILKLYSDYLRILIVKVVLGYLVYINE